MNEILDLLNEMSPYLLLGFLLAGLMHAFVPGKLYQRYLAGNDLRSVLYSALFGIPLPLCSCGVIPTAMSLRREGASKGSTVSFLIATPQTGVDSIFATYSLMGLPFAILRPLAALFTALAGGVLVNRLGDQEPSDATVVSQEQTTMQKPSFGTRLKEALHYGFVEMMQDIGKWLIIGLVVAALITIAVPDSFFSIFADKPYLSILAVLLFSIPMYLCATGSIPIAVALMLKGLSPGAALVLLMAGPASNAASILVINKVLGRKTLILYLSAIIGGAVLFGLGIDYLLPAAWFSYPLHQLKACCHTTPAYFNIACSIVLVLLLINAFVQRYRKPHNCSSCQHESAATVQVYTIEGMHCNHCRTNVEKALTDLEGVEEASVDLTSAQATIKGSVSKESVRKAVESIGFSLKD